MNPIVELVNRWDAFAQENADASIADFCRFYLASEENAKHSSDTYPDIPIESRLGRTFGRMSRFSSFYAKKALASVGINNIEDFGYLMALREMGSPRKSQLIQSSLSDFTTGIEVINRLIRMGLMEEFPDPDDRRSKRLKLTEKGLEVSDASLPVMHIMGKMVFSSLSREEQDILFQIILKLDRVHSDRYQDLRQMEWEDIRERFA
jgi:MarR family transcriptional regulator, lower aerobic nicotinate degradation pathway regulator